MAKGQQVMNLNRLSGIRYWGALKARGRYMYHASFPFAKIRIHFVEEIKHFMNQVNLNFPCSESICGTSLVAQWLRIPLPVQATRVRALVREDPTCRGATKPVRHNYWSPHAWSPCSATREATAMRSPCTAMKSSLHSLQLEKSPHAATKTQCGQK